VDFFLLIEQKAKQFYLKRKMLQKISITRDKIKENRNIEINLSNLQLTKLNPNQDYAAKVLHLEKNYH